MRGSEVPSLVYECFEVRMKDFVVRAPREYFHLEEDCFFTVDFHDMHRLLWHKGLFVTQVTLFAFVDSP